MRALRTHQQPLYQSFTALPLPCRYHIPSQSCQAESPKLEEWPLNLSRAPPGETHSSILPFTSESPIKVASFMQRANHMQQKATLRISAWRSFPAELRSLVRAVKRVPEGGPLKMSSTLPVLTTLCPICYTSPPKYRCPRCSMRTCSLECTQAHKVRASCSGIRDPAKFIPKREFKPSTIDMDFNFLKSVEKSREEGQSVVKKVDQGTSKTRKRKLVVAKRKRGMKKARERGVDVRELPEWMERTKENKVKWDAKNEYVLWTVEWNITIDEQTKMVIEHQIPDTAILEESFKSQGYAGPNLKFLFRKHDQPANGSGYYRLQGHKSLLENLQGMTFKEFPTIYVVDTLPSTWTVLEPQG